MRIKTGFYLSLVMGGVLVAGAVFLLGYSQFRMAAAVAQSQVWDRISTEGMELVQLTNEVLLYGEPRAVEQWQAQFAQVDRLCREAGAFGAGPAPALLRRVTVNLADMPPLFASLTRVRDGGPGDGGRVLLSSQLFQKTTVLQAALRDLKAASDADLSIAHGSSKERVFIVFAVFAGLTSVLGVVLSVGFRKAVLKPLQDLERTIGRINAGEAARRVKYLAEDEIGVVGRAFNRLLDRQEEDRLEIEFLAFHDALTRLPNRLLVRDRLEQAIAYAGRSGARVATMFLDLDNFKTINDSLGHPAGDALLRAVADRLRGCIRECDTIGRQGGDEFLITITELADVGDASAIAEKLLDALSQSFCIEGHELATSASIGIAICPDDSSDFDTLLKMADMAMYQAKAAGRNAYRFFTEQMNADASDHLVMRSGLRRALDRSEFVLYYQPQVDLASGRTIGLEALIRWNHPELGLVLPGRFIGVAEDSGLIVPMGDWVIGEACRQAAALAAAGFAGVSIAVNLSAVQFKRGNLEATIIDAIRAAGITPDCLELELTESMLIKDTESALAMVQRLKALGVKLSIDDFGTGYSSLSYLKRFNVDKLKIDQSFVRDLARDPDDAAIVRAIIQLARSLDLKTIAEGVEDATMLETLRTYGCDEVQGYHFARPMPAADLPAFLGR